MNEDINTSNLPFLLVETLNVRRICQIYNDKTQIFAQRAEPKQKEKKVHNINYIKTATATTITALEQY